MRRPELFNELEILLGEAYPLIDDTMFRRAVQHLHICNNNIELLVPFDPLARPVSNLNKKTAQMKEDLKSVRKTVGQEPPEELCLEEQKEESLQEPLQEDDYHERDPLGSLLFSTLICGNIYL